MPLFRISPSGRQIFISGPQGPQGTQGPQGSQGSQGPQGTQGQRGITGGRSEFLYFGASQLVAGGGSPWMNPNTLLLPSAASQDGRWIACPFFNGTIADFAATIPTPHGQDLTFQLLVDGSQVAEVIITATELAGIVFPGLPISQYQECTVRAIDGAGGLVSIPMQSFVRIND